MVYKRQEITHLLHFSAVKPYLEENILRKVPGLFRRFRKPECGAIYLAPIMPEELLKCAFVSLCQQPEQVPLVILNFHTSACPLAVNG